MAVAPGNPPPEPGATSQTLAARATFILALLAGAFLRLFHLGIKPLGFDEALSVFIARGSLDEILAKNLAFNSSPPFMALALNQMLRLGDSETVVRLLPALAGAATIPLIYLIARRFSNTICAALAALMFALSPAHILISREYRIYAIGGFVAALTILAALEFLRRPTPWWAIAAGIAMFSSIQVQYGLAPFVAALVAALALTMYRPGLPARRACLNLGIISLCSLAGVAAVYYSSLHAQFYTSRGGSYIWGYGANLAVDLARLPGKTLSLGRYAFPSDLFVFALGVGIYFSFRKQWRDVSLMTLAFSLGTAAVLSALDYYPYGAVRQCLFLTLLMYPIAAAGCGRLAAELPGSFRWPVAALFLAVLIGPALLVDVNVPRAKRDPADITAALDLVNREFRDGDILFVAPGAYPEFAHYGRNFRRSWVKGAGTEAWISDERAWGALVSSPPYVNQIDTLIRLNKRVWFLFTQLHPGEPKLADTASRRGWTHRIQHRMASPLVQLSLYQ